MKGILNSHRLCCLLHENHWGYFEAPMMQNNLCTSPSINNEFWIQIITEQYRTEKIPYNTHLSKYHKDVKRCAR